MKIQRGESVDANTRRTLISQAREIILAIYTPLEDELQNMLHSCVLRNSSVRVLVPQNFDACAIVKMLDAGFAVFDAVFLRDNLIFLDRKQGYRLPTWESVSDPFSRACDLLWRRVGYYVCIRDRVAQIRDSRMVKMVRWDHVWLNMSHVALLPYEGESLRVLANGPFFASETPLLDVVAIWHDEEINATGSI